MMKAHPAFRDMRIEFMMRLFFFSYPR